MVKRLLVGLLCLIMCCKPVNAAVVNRESIAEKATVTESAEETVWMYDQLDDGTISITGYLGNSTDVVIPSEIDGHDVTWIAYDAFWG